MIGKSFPRKFFSFGMIGGVIAIGGAGLLTLLIEVVHLNPQQANFIQAFVAIEVNFLLNSNITWRDRRQHSSFVSRFGRYHLSKVVTITVNQFLFWLLTSVGLHYLLVYLLNLGIITVLNFILNEKFVFRHHKEVQDESSELP